jgi:hypothetical protein
MSEVKGTKVCAVLSPELDERLYRASKSLGASKSELLAVAIDAWLGGIQPSPGCADARTPVDQAYRDGMERYRAWSVARFREGNLQSAPGDE